MNKTTTLRKAFVIALFALFSPLSLFSQDLIVMTSGDSINCTIQTVEDLFVRISYPKNEEKTGATISREQVKSMKFGYYKVQSSKGNSIFAGISRWRISARGGYSVGLGSPAILERSSDYESGLKNGYHIGVDGGYFFADFIGIGARFNFYKNSNDGTIIGEKKEVISISDNVNCFYVGPQVMGRFRDKKKKNAVLGHLSIGYLEYRNKYIEAAAEHKSRGSVFGADIGVGYERTLTENLALGIGFSTFLGKLTSIKDSYWEINEITGREEYKTMELSIPTRNLNRLNFSLYIVFNSGD